MTLTILLRILFLALLPALLPGCGESPPPAPTAEAERPRPAKIVTAQPVADGTTRSFPGTVRAVRESELAFRVGGVLVELPVQPGLRVGQGQLLARLDDADFRNTLADRQAKHKLAKTQHEQIRKLFEQNYTTQAKLDEAEANLKAAGAALALARDNLKYTELRAPFAGVIGRLAVENFQAVKAQEPVLQLQDEAGLEVVFNVPESLVARVQRTQQPQRVCASVTFNARPEEVYRACYQEHDSVPDSLTRGYTMVFSMPPIERFPVLPGMAVEVAVDLSQLLPESTGGGVTVPVEAVFDEAGGHWVWRVNDTMRVERAAVEVGLIRGDQLVVLEGLNPGDRVVAAGVGRLRAGQVVRPFVKERGL